MRKLKGKSRIGVTPIAAGLWIVLGLVFGLHAFGQQAFVDKLVLADTIQPVSSDELTRAHRRVPTPMVRMRC